MSSRALRKLQREQEEQRRLAAAQAQEEADRSSSEDVPVTGTKPKNAFDMLEEEQSEPTDDEETTGGVMTPATDASRTQPSPSRPLDTTPAKSKKKKKKPKKRPKEKAPQAQQDETASEDEVDRAIKLCGPKIQRWSPRLLSADTKNLNPINEMKSLFGNVAVEEHESRPANRNPRQREVNDQGGMDLGTALLGRNNVASRGKELGALAGRRNCLMRGREEWPLASSGGLSMENISDSTSFERRYNILHNSAYEETQWRFRQAVESMDPQRMMSQLVLTPYHIASLLQVAEIARHQGDHSVSGDLLERALYTIGKSVHSSFPAAMREGTARLPFDKAANREVYLAIWRYIRNLEMRGTFKTAFEWTKLLLQLNTLSDPYGATLMIDQMALRGRCHDQLIAMAADDAYGSAWSHLPNIAISLALAHLRAKQPREARRQLALAMHQYPYILSALASALEIQPLPKTLWAKLPSTDAEKLYTELYVTRTKDLWNTPETTALVVEVAQTLQAYKDVTSAAPVPPKLEISLEEARHIILLEDPHLLALLPRQFTRMPNSGYDPLPPPDTDGSDFTSRAPRAGDGANDPAGSGLRNVFGIPGGIQRLLNWFQTPVNNNAAVDPEEGAAAMAAFRAQFGNDIPDEVIEQLIATHLEDSNGEQHEPVDPEGLGLGQRLANNMPTPGGWDYYAEMAEQPSDYDRDDSSDMPSLEDIPTAETRPTAAPTPPPIQQRHPRAAMVEEDIDEDDQAAIHHPTPARAVLRHVDSDSETEDPAVDSDGIPPHPRRPTHTLFSTNAPTTAPIIASQRRRSSLAQQSGATATEPQRTAEEEREMVDNDPQRLQRWLLTSGLAELKPGMSTGNAVMAEYLRRMKLLRPKQRDWVLGMVEQRGGDSKGVVESVRRGLDA
ncbi:Ribosome quality control complex subunit 1 [Cyphellophora attinorum]|uniref:Ribosome quality control complex subunit 1 n=1 Tax=Cyphellophora attinorum TaxID=1664694 RepID=A0A0N1H813_9EURO|nr:Ribosome quality control complex subunit 1 [Phialophora attinorum]KPI42842.1 Ribosome quality control complex subunit 1 [Phialophora attinorum]